MRAQVGLSVHLCDCSSIVEEYLTFLLEIAFRTDILVVFGNEVQELGVIIQLAVLFILVVGLSDPKVWSSDYYSSESSECK